MKFTDLSLGYPTLSRNIYFDAIVIFSNIAIEALFYILQKIKQILRATTYLKVGRAITKSNRKKLKIATTILENFKTLNVLEFIANFFKICIPFLVRCILYIVYQKSNRS